MLSFSLEAINFIVQGGRERGGDLIRAIHLFSPGLRIRVDFTLQLKVRGQKAHCDGHKDKVQCVQEVVARFI